MQGVDSREVSQLKRQGGNRGTSHPGSASRSDQALGGPGRPVLTESPSNADPVQRLQHRHPRNGV